MNAEQKYEFFRSMTIQEKSYNLPSLEPISSKLYSLLDLKKIINSGEIATLLPPETALYIHVPFCQGRKCTFCMYKSQTNYASRTLEEYKKRILKEFEFRRDELISPLRNVYVGGGTPSIYNADSLFEILSPLETKNFSKTAEKTCELSPNTATLSHIDALAALKFNRISFGIQSLSSKLLNRVKRENTKFELISEFIEYAIKRGFSVNLDLMVGLPYQTENDLENSISKILMTKATEITVYFFRDFSNKFSPEAQQINLSNAIKSLHSALPKIKNAGWRYIAGDDTTEFHHFISPNYIGGRQKYMTRINGMENYSVCGFGAYANGFTPSIAYTCISGNPKFDSTEKRYAVRTFSRTEQMRLCICTMLYNENMSLNNDTFKNAFGSNIYSIFRNEIEELLALKKIKTTTTGFKITADSFIEAATLSKFFWTQEWINSKC